MCDGIVVVSGAGVIWTIKNELQTSVKYRDLKNELKRIKLIGIFRHSLHDHDNESFWHTLSCDVEVNIPRFIPGTADSLLKLIHRFFWLNNNLRYNIRRILNWILKRNKVPLAAMPRYALNLFYDIFLLLMLPPLLLNLVVHSHLPVFKAFSVSSP